MEARFAREHSYGVLVSNDDWDMVDNEKEKDAIAFRPHIEEATQILKKKAADLFSLRDEVELRCSIARNIHTFRKETKDVTFTELSSFFEKVRKSVPSIKRLPKQCDILLTRINVSYDFAWDEQGPFPKFDAKFHQSMDGEAYKRQMHVSDARISFIQTNIRNMESCIIVIEALKERIIDRLAALVRSLGKLRGFLDANKSIFAKFFEKTRVTEPDTNPLPKSGVNPVGVTFLKNLLSLQAFNRRQVLRSSKALLTERLRKGSSSYKATEHRDRNYKQKRDQRDQRPYYR